MIWPTPRTLATASVRVAVLLAIFTGGMGFLGAADLRPLWAQANGQIVPLSAAPGESEFQFFGDTVILIHKAADERVVYTWELPGAEAMPPFGKITCQVSREGEEGPPALIPVAGNAVLEFTEEIGQSKSQWAAGGAPGKFKLLRQLQVGSEIVTLSVTGGLVGKSLVLEMTCDKPLVTKCLPGHLGSPGYRTQQAPRPAPAAKAEEEKPAEEKKEDAPAAPPPAPRIAPPEKLPEPKGGKNMRRVSVPFMTGEVRVFLEEKVFGSAMADWRISNDSGKGVYGALSNGSRNTLVERFVYTASKDFRQVLPNVPNPPSPHREELGGRIWFEVAKDYPFELSLGYVDRLSARGMRDYVMVLPTWQNLGPDAGLPTHFPAKGKEEELEFLEELGEACEKAGIRFALQEEYSDMWPDYEKFSERYLATSPEGTPATGYRNPRARMPDNQQASIIKPELVAKFAADEGKTINRGYGTSAAYLNRHSSSPTSRGIDYAAGETGAGMARHVYAETAKLFAQQREVHGGPVLGRGGAHWIYGGVLDGASAQPGAGWAARGGQKLPLLVDFDLLRMHPLGVTFGMGEVETWRMAPDPDKGGHPWGAGVPMFVLDQYRMQQLIFGHGSMLAGYFHDGEGLHWLEHHLVLPVAKAYAAANPLEIHYQVGGEWVDTSAAVLAQELSVVRVRYENGLEITANGSEEEVNLGALVLPQFGWVARQGDGLLAYTALKDGMVVDYAKTGNAIFANARRFEDWEQMKHLDGYKEPRGTEEAWKTLHLNEGAGAIDFGSIRTEGSVNLRKDDQEWVLTTYPVDAVFEVQLAESVFRAPYEVKSTGGAERSVQVEKSGDGWWKIPLNGAVEYRFP